MLIYVPSVGYRLFVGYKNKVSFNNQVKASGGARWGRLVVRLFIIYIKLNKKNCCIKKCYKYYTKVLVFGLFSANYCLAGLNGKCNRNL